jgi:predicted Zn-dependent peptidase
MTTPRSILIAAALPLALLGATGAPPQITPPSVQSSGGATVVQQADTAAALTGVTLVVRAGLDRQTMRQNGLAALTAETILRTPVTDTAGRQMALDEAVAVRGGSIRFTVDPGDVRFYVEALAADAPAVLDLFRTALVRPDFSATTVRDARMQLATEIAANQRVALDVGLDMLNAASSLQANTGFPELGTPASLAQFVPDDVQRFHSDYYRRGGVLVSAAGRLELLEPNALAVLGTALPAGSTTPVTVSVRRIGGSSHELVAHRDISSPWLIAQYPAPVVSSRDFGPMLVLAAFLRRTISDIAQVPGVVTPTFASRSVGAVYVYDRVPSSLVLYVNGGLIGSPSRTFETALSVVNVLAGTRLQGSIEEFKAIAAGDFANDATTLETRTWLAAVFAGQSSSPDFINRGLASIAATHAADVQRVARTYLASPTIALVLPRSATPSD